MSTDDLDRLAQLVAQEREPMLSRWRQQVRELPSARDLDIPTLNDHIPGLLDELVAALRANSEESIPEALSEGSSPAHGLQRVEDAYDITEVVAEYNILRGCIHDLGDSAGLNLQGRPFHIINRTFDQAIGLAVETYATQRALEVQQRRADYLAFVAHDLRTPLNAIALAGRVLEFKHKAGVTDAEAAQMINSLRRNVQNLESLVDNVLEENANLETEIGVKLQLRNFDLWPLVEALIHDLHPVAGTASTKLTNQVPEDLIVRADASLLKRILQNLIANAIEHTPHGEITIGAINRNEPGVVECWVSDNGKGIPEADLVKIFDKGETDQGHDGGLGLGLAIVKTFTEAHGGTVTVESQKLVGSTFRIILPADPGSKTARKASDRSSV